MNITSYQKQIIKNTLKDSLLFQILSVFLFPIISFLLIGTTLMLSRINVQNNIVTLLLGLSSIFLLVIEFILPLILFVIYYYNHRISKEDEEDDKKIKLHNTIIIINSLVYIYIGINILIYILKL